MSAANEPHCVSEEPRRSSRIDRDGFIAPSQISHAVSFGMFFVHPCRDVAGCARTVGAAIRSTFGLISPRGAHSTRAERRLQTRLYPSPFAFLKVWDNPSPRCTMRSTDPRSRAAGEGVKRWRLLGFWGMASAERTSIGDKSPLDPCPLSQIAHACPRGTRFAPACSESSSTICDLAGYGR